MHARFYVPGGAHIGEPVALPPEESEHLIRVLRLGPGAVVAIFDGQGREYEARVDSVTRDRAVVTPTSVRQPAAEPGVRVTLAVGVTRGDRMESAVRDAAMLGASAVQPVITARADTTAGALARGHRVERWRRIAISSVKQCGRAVVPDVREPLALDDYLASETADMRLMLVEPRATGASRLSGASAPETAAVLIGPEGGWTLEEIQAARVAGFHAITLGERTLRADAVPVAALAVLQFIWGDL